jgi:hypothetical protein
MLTRKLLFLSIGFAVWLPTIARADVSSISICDSVPGNLVVNCGFESGDFSGWTQSGNTGFTLVTAGSPFFANSGDYGAQLGPMGSDGFLSQDIPTAPGDTYTISWYLDTNGGGPSDFSVLWNGNQIFSESTTTQQNTSFYTGFIRYSSNEYANPLGDSTTLTFEFRNDQSYWGLDDIGVVLFGTPPPTVTPSLGGFTPFFGPTPPVPDPPTTPEPGYLGLLTGGVAGLIWFERRRAKKEPSSCRRFVFRQNK